MAEGDDSGVLGPLRVVVADRHSVTRLGVRAALESIGLVVVRETADGPGALTAVRELDPDVLVTDIRLTGMDGLALIAELSRTCPRTRVVVLTDSSDAVTRQQVSRAGATGFASKDREVADLVEIIVTAATEARPIPGAGGVGTRRLLTDRELEILRGLAAGTGTAQLSAQLYISPKTLRNHLSSIYEKLGVHDRTQALVKAAALGLVTLG